MSLHSFIFVTLTTLFIYQSRAQRNYDDYNLLGLQGGLSQTNILTDDFTTEVGSGFIGGFTSRGAFRNNFDLIYGINFVSSNVDILANNGSEDVFVTYSLEGAQINFLGSFNIVKKHLSLEFGPMLNINGKLKPKSESQNSFLLDGYDTLKVEDIQDVSKINFHLAGGVTAGLEHFRISALYQYGVTNLFGKLNDADLEKTDFEGHVSIVSLAAVLYF